MYSSLLSSSTGSHDDEDVDDEEETRFVKGMSDFDDEVDDKDEPTKMISYEEGKKCIIVEVKEFHNDK